MLQYFAAKYSTKMKFCIFVSILSSLALLASGEFAPEFSDSTRTYEDEPSKLFPEYEEPKQGYEAPKEPHNNPKQDYEPPRNPSPGYEAPKESYNPPRQDYEPPRIPPPGYEAPKDPYNPPRQDYEPPRIPPPGYEAPKEPARVPREDYNNPRPNYDASKDSYKNKQPDYNNDSKQTYGEYSGSRECNCVRWTNWISADTPSNSGDFETIGPPDAKGRVGTVHHVRPDICTLPLRMECRTLHDAIPWYLANEHVTEKCTPHDKGFSCENKKQAHGKCKDYEIRLLCFYSNGNDCPCLYWTEWYDTYDPIGKGDLELIGKQLPKYVCEHGFQPVDVQCETVHGLDIYHAGNKKVKCDLEGLSCYNEDQGRNCKCHDYRIRFLCPKFPSNYPIPEYDFNTNKTYGSGDYGSGHYDGGEKYEQEKYIDNTSVDYNKKPYEKQPDYVEPKKEYPERPPYEQPPPAKLPPPYEQPAPYEQPPPVKLPPPYEEPRYPPKNDYEDNREGKVSGDYAKAGGGYGENDRDVNHRGGGYRELDRGNHYPDRDYHEPERGNQYPGRDYNEHERGNHYPDEPERGPYNEPERGGYHEPERGGYHEPERGEYNKPERGGYNEPERGAYNEHDGRYNEREGGYNEHDRPYPSGSHRPYVKPKKTILSGIVSKSSVQEGHSGKAVNFKYDQENRPEYDQVDEGHYQGAPY